MIKKNTQMGFENVGLFFLSADPLQLLTHIAWIGSRPTHCFGEGNR